MRFERRFLVFKEDDAPTASDGDIHNLVDMLNQSFRTTQADWMEEETRFSVGNLTVVGFKLTYLDDEENVEAIYSDEKIEPVAHVFNGVVEAQNITVDHFAVDDTLTLRGENNKRNEPWPSYSDSDDSWW